jgi:hypothetical protein
MKQKYSYDPLQGVGSWWNELSEEERLDLIIDHHRRKRVRLPNARMHTLAHLIVENQALLGEETPVRATLDRLIGEGLDRHEAVHAVGMVLLGLMWEVCTDRLQTNPATKYYQELQELSAEKWLSQAEYVDGSLVRSL